MRRLQAGLTFRPLSFGGTILLAISGLVGLPLHAATTDILWRNYGAGSQSGQNTIWFMQGTQCTTQDCAAYLAPASIPPQTDLNWKIVGTGDFNGDGQTDIVWRNYSTGQNLLWYMNGSTYSSWATLPACTDLNWEIVGTGDFNADGHLDLLWRDTHVSGGDVVWFMNNTTYLGSTYIQGETDLNWKVVGTGDFNGDAHPDILWRHAVSGQNAVWYMNGSGCTSQGCAWFVSSAMLLTVADLNWAIVGTGYFNLDGYLDILWRNCCNGANVIWFMNNTTKLGSTYIAGQTDPDWRIVGTGEFGSPPADDYGNNMGSAALMNPDTIVFGAINYAGDEDFFRLVCPPGTLTAYTTGTTDTYGYLLDASGSVLTYNDDNPYPNFRFSYDVPGGTYYIRVRHYSSTGTGGYTLAVQHNVLVNDRAQDCGTEQNSQFESTCAVLNGRVIVAYVDSKQIPGPEPRSGGVYGLGGIGYLSDRTPRLVGYAVSEDNGLTFTEKGKPPLSTQGQGTSDDGDAGDPVLAVDKPSNNIVYLVGTSPRNAGWKGIPLWQSTDGGVNFGNPINVHSEITSTDKPWITVDNATGTGQHDVYLTFTSFGAIAIRLTVSTDYGVTWPTLQTIQTGNVQSAIPVIGPDHVAYVFWWELSGGINYLKVRKVLNRGATLGTIYPVRQLVTTGSPYGNLDLKRSNSAGASDTFRAFPFPVPAVNPSASKSNHLYVAYADKGVGSDKADVFFLRSTDGGVNWDGGTNGWTSPQRISTLSDNDQWMPVIAVKPDGTKLFVAWYDRRADVNNSLIEVYGRWATIATDGTVTFGTEFKLSTASFPPVFAGTLPDNTIQGHYDPVYPPYGVNLKWWYPEWPLVNEYGDPVLTDPLYIGHVGEYNGAWAEGSYVYVTWTDYRLLSSQTTFARNQSDIRFVRLTWPQ